MAAVLNTQNEEIKATQDENEDVESVKILFLDVDGVLNRTSLFSLFDDAKESEEEEQKDQKSGLHLAHLQRLKTILSKTDCRIVLSSAWRLFEASKKTLFQALERHIQFESKLYLGDTPKRLKNRVTEIKQWLEGSEWNYNVVSWVSVDDIGLDEIDAECKAWLSRAFGAPVQLS